MRSSKKVRRVSKNNSADDLALSLPAKHTSILIRSGSYWYKGAVVGTTRYDVKVEFDGITKRYKKKSFGARWHSISNKCPRPDLISGPYGDEIADLIATMKRKPPASPKWVMISWNGDWCVGKIVSDPYRPPRGRQQVPGIAIDVRLNSGETVGAEPHNGPVFVEHETPYLLTRKTDLRELISCRTDKSPLPRERSHVPLKIIEKPAFQSPEKGHTVIATAPDRWGEQWRIGKIVEKHTARDGAIIQVRFDDLEEDPNSAVTLGYPKVVVELIPILDVTLHKRKAYTENEAKELAENWGIRAATHAPQHFTSGS